MPKLTKNDIKIKVIVDLRLFICYNIINLNIIMGGLYCFTIQAGGN